MPHDPPENPLALRLFGPMELHVCGAPICCLRSRKGYWLLALLALRHGREVSRAWLSGTLWPDNPEPQAAHSLRTSLNDLRRALGSEACRLASPTPRTLLLDLTGADVDLLVFDRAIARGDPVSLEEALSLYRGPLLEECAEEWALQEREVRELAYLRASEVLASRALATGDPGTAEQLLRRAVAIDPFRESAQRALMQALVAQGSHTAAMEVYRELRQRLHRETNAVPDAETQALYEQVRAEARARVAAPRVQRSVALPRQQSRAIRRHTLPLPLTSFVGREQQIEEIAELLEHHRLVTLTGVGGGGKTRLALEVARRLTDRFDDGVRLVELAALTDSSLVTQAVARALELEQSGETSEAALARALKDRELLLVLDNCEHLVAACAGLAEALLASCPEVRLLVTSREVLGVPGEVAYEVPPLSLPAARPVDAFSLRVLLQSESVRLFAERAATVQPGFQFTEQNAAAVTQICRRLDGIPLAIELAAAWVKVLSVEQIAGRLDDRFELLRGRNRVSLPRHRSLHATIAWSYDLLDEPDRRLFRRLAVFAGGSTLDAAEAVCDASLDGMASLVDKSLVQRSEIAGEPRFTMLETVREFAREHLRASGEEAALRQRHAAHFLALSERAEPLLQQSCRKEWLDRLEAEHDNFRAVLDAAVGAGGSPDGTLVVEAGLRVAGALRPFWLARHHTQEARERLTAMLALPDAAPRSGVRARLLHGIADCTSNRWFGHHDPTDVATKRACLEESLAIFCGHGDRAGTAAVLLSMAHLSMGVGETMTARRQVEESLALRREIDDRPGIAASLQWRGLLDEWAGENDSARRFYHEALAIWRELGCRWGTATPLHGLSDLALHEGDPETAAELLAECLEIRKELGDKHPIAGTLDTLAEIVAERGEYGTAEALHQEAIDIAREFEDRSWITGHLLSLAGIAQCQGHYPTAQALCEQCLVTARELADGSLIGSVLNQLGALAYAQGDLNTAEERLEEGRTVSRALVSEDRSGNFLYAWSLTLLAQVACARGEYETADALLEESLALWPKWNLPRGAAFPLCVRGQVALARGDPDRAASLLTESLTLRQRWGQRLGIAECMEALAAVAIARDEANEAARLLGAAAAHREAIGAPLPPVAQPGHDRTLAAARTALGNEAFEAIWTSGQAEVGDRVTCHHESSDRP
jgi:predicted ATPase/DNA-binding SARP family transcriptional activator